MTQRESQEVFDCFSKLLWHRRAEGSAVHAEPSKAAQATLHLPTAAELSPCRGPERSNAVLYAVALLGALAVVEAIQGAHQVAGDAANALEGLVAEVVG